MPSREPRKQAQQRAVRTKEPAVGPADKNAHQQEASAEDEHVRASIHAEETDERIVAADQKSRAGDGEQYGRAEKYFTKVVALSLQFLDRKPSDDALAALEEPAEEAAPEEELAK